MTALSFGDGFLHETDRIKTKVLIRRPFHNIHVQDITKLMENGRGRCLAAWIGRHHQMTQGQDMIMVRQPFPQTKVFIHDQQTSRKGFIGIGIVGNVSSCCSCSAIVVCCVQGIPFAAAPPLHHCRHVAVEKGLCPISKVHYVEYATQQYQHN